MLTAEQREIRQLARDFAEGEIIPHAAAWERRGTFGGEILDKLAQLGFLGMLVPPEYGGLGFDVPTYLVALEEIARGDAALALTVAIQNGPVPHILLAHGTEEQKSRWLPALAAGEKIAAFALSEAGAGSDPAAMATRARENDGDHGGWVLTGTKRWVTNGARADLVVAFARTGRDHGAKTPIGAFLLDTATEGYRVGKRETTMGLRASETVRVELDGVRVTDRRLVGDRGSGLRYALGALDLGRLGIAAQAVGIAQASVEHAARYARERRQFGRPIASFGAVRSKLAVMATRIAASRALFMEGAAAWEQRDRLTDGGLPITARSAMAKLFASETAGLVTEEAVRIFGGYGFMREFPVEKLMRDAKGTEIYEGTSEILRFVIGRSLTDDR